MKILVDRGQQKGKHEEKHNYLQKNGAELISVPLPVGDYVLCNDLAYDVIIRKEKRKVDIKKMDFLGSYCVAVDTKRNIQEIIGNIAGKQHNRFRDECILAKNNNIKLYVLIENLDGVNNIDDLETWVNPRSRIYRWITGEDGRRMRVQKYSDATKGSVLAKAMSTMQEKYGVSFLFCRPELAGETIINLLMGG